MDSAGTQSGVEEISQPQLQELQPTIARGERWSELGLVFLIAVAPLILTASSYLLYPKTARFTPGFSVAARLLHEISALLLVLYFLKRRGSGVKSLGLVPARWTDPLQGLGLALAGVFVSAIFSIFVRSASTSITGQSAEMRDPRVIFAGITPGWFVIYSFGAAIFEETIVRAYVTSELIALACPVWLATLTSIALQTSYHLYYGWGGALALSGVFAVFGIYFAKSRRLLPVILGHLFVDLWAIWANHLR